MAKGIIIDVGFKAEIKDFIDSIEKDFKKIDFDSIVGLSDAFDNQAKEVRRQLSKLKEEIERTINGNVSGDANKQLQSLNKAVGILTSSFKELLKNTPTADKGIISQLDLITQEVNEVTSVCENATRTINDLSNATKKDIKFVDSNQKEELKEIFRLLEQARAESEKMGTTKNQHGYRAYEEEEDALKDLLGTYRVYSNVKKEIQEVNKNETLSEENRTKELDRLNASLVISITNLSRMITTYSKLNKNWDTFTPFKNSKTTLEDLQYSLDEPLERALKYIAKRKAEIQQAYSELGGGDLQELFIKGQSKDDVIKIPISISSNARDKLFKQAVDIINLVQENISDHPLEVEVKLLSSYKSKNNQKILNEIQAGLQNIDNEEVRTNILSLIDNMSKQIDNALLFNVDINTEKATKAVREFVKDARSELDQLSQNLAPLEPEIILTDEHRAAFQKQLDAAKGDFKIQIGIMDGEDTIDKNATKKELTYLKLLRERVEAVSKAVEIKTSAFEKEESSVKNVITNEINSLIPFYEKLNLIEKQIKEITTAFALIPKTFKMDFDEETLESINNLANNKTLSILASAKQDILSFISLGSGSLIEIPDDQKNILLKDIQNLSTQINNIFETKEIDNWTSKLIVSLTEISNKIKTLFGNNALSDMIEQWTSSDELMIKSKGRNHVRERAAVVDTSGNIYGAGTYDQNTSTIFVNKIVEELKKRGIISKIGVHSHGSDRIVASSIPQGKGRVAEGADLGANYYQYIKNGIEKQLTIALNDIELFDAKGFYDSNSSINFNDDRIKNLIRDKKNEIQREIAEHFYQFFQQFVSQYGKGNGLNLKDELFNNIKTSNNNEAFKKAIYEAVDPQVLLDNFFRETKQNKGSLAQILSKALINSFVPSNIESSLGISKEEANKMWLGFREDIKDNAKKILDNVFDISKFDYDTTSGNYRDIATFNFRQITPRILEEALAGEGYKNNYQDFMKVFSKEDFIRENPLGLSSISFSDIFDNAIPTTFLQTLDKIVEDLIEIKELSSSENFSNAFNIKIDKESLSTFTNEIALLIESVEKLPAMLTESFSILGNTTSFDPLKNLESTYNTFKNFYDNNDLESKAGAEAALSYYNAYKEALISKVNKKDLQQYTIGKTDNLFTGNYSNYKKGLEDLDLSGLNSEIVKYQEVIDKFNQPEVISIINALTEAIEKLITTGNTSAEATALLKNLNTVINNLGGKNSSEKIAKVTENLENFQKSIQELDISDSGFIQSLSSILEKGEELKILGDVLKSTKKQIDTAGKAVKSEENLKQAQQYLEQYESSISEAVNKKYGSENVLYQNLQATKDGLVQVIALIKEASGEYKKYLLTTTDGSDLNVKAINKDQAALEKEVKQWQIYQKLKELAVPGATNLGKEGVTFTPESDNWDKLVDKVREFGIELENINKIVRNVDQVGNESFQIFTDLSRITIGMNSNGVLFQKDDVLDASKAIQDFENDVEKLKQSLSTSFKDDMGTEKFLNTLNDISSVWKELTFLNKNGFISNEDISKLLSYFNSFKSSIPSFSLDKISQNNKTPEFISQLKEAENQLNLVKIALDKVETGEAFTDEDISNIKLFISQMRELYSTSNDKGNKLGSSETLSKYLKKIYKNLNDNSSMSAELKQKFIELYNEMESFGGKIPLDKLQEFKIRFQDLDTEMHKTGQTGLSFFDGIIKRAKSMSQSFISMYLSLYDIVRYIKTGITTITELDTALTEMRKVSDESTESLKRFQKASFDIAGTVGTTAKQIQNSTADWMRLGESLDEASKSAEVSNILLNVSEFESIDEATESLVAMSAAYSELDKMSIVDKLNEVGNNFAISTDGLATALQNSASALKTAGNDINEAIALTTAGNQVVQDPNKVGAGKLMPEHIVICGYFNIIDILYQEVAISVKSVWERQDRGKIYY